LQLDPVFKIRQQGLCALNRNSGFGLRGHRVRARPAA
jgi:hypothetical protein